MSGVNFLALGSLFLLAAVIAVPISKRLGLGSVLGYLLAGIALSPILAWLHVDAVQISHFAEFGVVMMLFLVGLELEPRKFLGEAGPILGIGGGQMLVTGVLIFAALAFFTAWPWQINVAIALALALSSTAIALQTLGEIGQLRATAGQRSFNVLLFQDIAVIPILAAMPLLALGPDVLDQVSALFHVPEPAGPAEYGTGGSTHADNSHHGDDGEHGHAAEPGFFQTLPGWAYGLSVVVVLGGTMVGGRFLLNPVFGILARTRIMEMMTAAALLVVVGVSFLMGQLGLSAALGAFVAGVALADSEYRHELEGNIEPFKGLLMGLFFMSVGASIQFGLIVSEPVAIIGSALGLVGLKTLLLIAIGWVIGLRGAPLALFAILLGQGGEFAFVLLQAMTSESVVPLEIADRVNAVVALSMLSTPLLMLLYTLVLEPYFSSDANKDAESDVEDEGSDVIVVGFGPFGQIVSRLLLLNGVKTTILDYDAEQIESLRRFGARVFYGDAARADLLKSAGANDAKMVVVCESERERSLAIVTMIKHHFPHLTICAQARDRGHVYELINEGVEVFERETFEGALTLGEQALVGLGWKPYSARIMVEKFNKSDRDNLSEQARVLKEGGMDALIKHAMNYRQVIEQQFEEDRKKRGIDGAHVTWAGHDSRQGHEDD